MVDVIENAPLAIHIKSITGDFIWTNKFEQELFVFCFFYLEVRTEKINK